MKCSTNHTEKNSRISSKNKDLQSKNKKKINAEKSRSV